MHINACFIIVIDCGPPEDIYNGLPLYNSTVYGAQALYVCHEGYEEQTYMNVYCGNNGLWISTNETWLGRRPICEGILLSKQFHSKLDTHS